MNSVEELLVVLIEPPPTETLEELRSRYTIGQAASRRLLLLNAPEAEPEEIARIAGVRAVLTDEIPEELLEEFNLTEKLFARGWATRRREAPKTRRGAGLPWDAEGFQPPDRPAEWEEEE